MEQIALVPVASSVPAIFVIGNSARAPRRLVDAWLEGRSPRTREAYAGDLADFARFISADSPEAAAAALLARGAGPANELALAYRNAQVERGLASATVNRRLAALRSLVEVANVIGAVPWSLRVKNLRAEPRRDTRGPAEAGVRALLVELAARPGPKGIRDRAIFRLLLDLGLRRFEVTGLELEHLDVAAATVAVLRKGKRERRTLSLPGRTVAALQA